MTLLDASGVGTPLLALLQALSAFVLVLLLVWLGRKKLAQGGMFKKRSEHIQVEERLPLDLGNALLIVRVEDKRLLLSISNQGPARLLVELTGANTASEPAAQIESVALRHDPRIGTP